MISEKDAIKMKEQAKEELINANESAYKVMDYVHVLIDCNEIHYAEKIKYYEQQASHARILRVCLTGKP